MEGYAAFVDGDKEAEWGLESAHVPLSLSLSVSLSVSLCLSLSLCLFLCFSVFLSLSLFICLSLYSLSSFFELENTNLTPAGSGHCFLNLFLSKFVYDYCSDYYVDSVFKTLLLAFKTSIYYYDIT